MYIEEKLARYYYTDSRLQSRRTIYMKSRSQSGWYATRHAGTQIQKLETCYTFIYIHTTCDCGTCAEYLVEHGWRKGHKETDTLHRWAYWMLSLEVIGIPPQNPVIAPSRWWTAVSELGTADWHRSHAMGWSREGRLHQRSFPLGFPVQFCSVVRLDHRSLYF